MLCLEKQLLSFVGDYVIKKNIFWLQTDLFMTWSYLIVSLNFPCPGVTQVPTRIPLYVYIDFESQTMSGGEVFPHKRLVTEINKIRTLCLHQPDKIGTMDLN